ncbi:hypothetical protein HZA87_02535 [Candidatus Uhrbacteria bacterium]|nr:hypothetical protein [Candidatus Uhrbacteria bacterium]
MMENNQVHTFANLQPSVDTEQASFESLSRDLITLKEEFQHQRNESRGIILGVVVAALFVFITIGVEVIIFHTR